MPSVNEVLRNLGAADQKVSRIARKVRQKPQEISNDEALVGQAERAVTAQQQRTKELQLKTRSAEKVLSEKENELLKTKSQQNAAKSNEEFDAHGRRIKALESEISDLESQILEAMDEVESSAEEIAVQERRLQSAKEQLNAAKAKIDGELAELNSQLNTAMEHRQSVLDQLSGDDRGRYLTAFKQHKFKVVASAQSGVCQGCFVSLRPNDRISVEAGNEVVVCSNCERVLHRL